MPAQRHTRRPSRESDVERQIEDLIAAFGRDLDDAGYVAALEELQARAEAALAAFREEHSDV